MIEVLDKLDEALLNRINTTQCSSIRDVIRPFLLEKSESVLRTRVRYLELHKLIQTTKTPHGRIKCAGVMMTEQEMEADHLEMLEQFDQAYQDQAARKGI